MTIGFALAGGEGRIGRRATYLVRSIQQFHPDAPILVTIPTSESPPTSLTEQDIKIARKPFPDPNYPISIKIESLRQAERQLETDWVCLLDTDTILVEPFTAHKKTTAQLRVKPVDMATQFWGQADVDEWKPLYDRYDIETPSYRVKSTVDNQEIWPYWNAGVVLVQAGDLGNRWRDLTLDLRSKKLEASHHADQVALAVLSGDYDVEPLTERYNCPVHLRMWTCPPKSVLHYHNENWLLCSSKYDQIYNKIGIDTEFPHSRSESTMIKLAARSVRNEIKCRLGLWSWGGAW
ncbi:hypothetical protein [Halorubrum distributum]|uniref:hypothetical protein n=1 Tax=Halorubrum distributum TaxID=29283 RepID=UPI0012687AD0|nr:hypothetical protein [Halorubrum terrestre]